MKKSKRETLGAAGWAIGSVPEFLNGLLVSSLLVLGASAVDLDQGDSPRPSCRADLLEPPVGN